MKSIISFSIVFLLLFAFSFSGFSQANPKIKVKVEASKLKEGQASSSNQVKSGKPTTDTKSEAEGTAGGSGPYSCRVLVDNYTDYCVDIYVDGVWCGSLGPWGAMTVFTGNGWTTLYAQSCGGSFYWNMSGSCGSAYAFELWP